ncbi:MAG TPA: helix-turn-helix domain-containing protein [Micromonosporaceae bacterium]|nr:helix-turn-helix domain-containing protein [Micromonosporaceae bacterium]
MADATHAFANLHPSRAAWRDAIKSSHLTPKARAIALTLADYWPQDRASPLWCTIPTLIEQTGFSRASVYRAMAELRDGGYLLMVEKRHKYKSPRYRPLLPAGPTPGEVTPAVTPSGKGGATVEMTADVTPIPIQRSQRENPEVSQRHPTPYVDSTQGSRSGSDDLDCQSGRAKPARAAAEPAPTGFAGEPRNQRERQDFDRLARHMSNYGEHVATVYAWMRTGQRPRDRHVGNQTPIRWPGAFAAKKSGTWAVGDMTEWQGYFRRHFCAEGASVVVVSKTAVGARR